MATGSNRRRVRWATVERVTRILISIAGEVLKYIDAFHHGR